MRQTTLDLLYLSGCALNSVAPDAARVSAMDSEALLKEAERHKVAAVLAVAFEQLEDPAAVLGKEAWKQWHMVRNRALRRALLFDTEREEILSEMEKQGIWYLPLKGILVQHYYPQYGMREMADNDILIDESKRKEMDAIMLGRGYTVERGLVHDEYLKEPLFNFEMHRRFFPKSSKLNQHFNVKQRGLLLKDEDREFGRHMRVEDLYSYVIAHAYKHYIHGGVGLKILMDSYVIRQKEKMDEAYLAAALDRMHIREFDAGIRTLGDHLFAHPETFSEEVLSESDRKMADYLAESGAYGTEENSVLHSIQELVDPDLENVTTSVKQKYVFRRLFPSFERMRIAYPVLEKWPVLLPAMYVVRWGKAMTKRATEVRREIKAMRKL